MKNSIGLCAVIVGSIACAAVAAEKDTPKDAYDIDMTCAAVAGAATTQVPAGAQGSSPPADDRHSAASLKTYYEKRASASGERAGVSAARVTQDIDAFRQSIVRRMNARDPARADKEKTDNADMLQRCSALPFFELEHRLGQ